MIYEKKYSNFLSGYYNIILYCNIHFCINRNSYNRYFKIKKRRINRRVNCSSFEKRIEILTLEEKDGWYKVSAKVNGKTVEGYVASKYVKVEETETPVKNEVVPEENTVKEEETNTEENKNEITEQNEENKIMVKTLPANTQIYITPLINSLPLDTFTEEKRIEITSEVDGWSYITTGDIKGWVRTDEIVEKEVSEPEQNTSSQKTGYISGNSVSLREEANSSSNVILNSRKEMESFPFLSKYNKKYKNKCTK